MKPGRWLMRHAWWLLMLTASPVLACFPHLWEWRVLSRVQFGTVWGSFTDVLVLSFGILMVVRQNFYANRNVVPQLRESFQDYYLFFTDMMACALRLLVAVIALCILADIFALDPREGYAHFLLGNLVLSLATGAFIRFFQVLGAVSILLSRPP